MAGDYNDIVDSNGEIIRVSADNSADGVRMVQDGQQLVVVDEDALTAFATRTGQTLEELEPVRSLVTGGNLNNVPQFGQYGDVQFQSIDAQNLKLGAFPEAEALAEAYLENFYKSSADQVERIHHGMATSQTVAGDSMTTYLDADGNIAADVTAVNSELADTGLITTAEFTELQSGSDTEAPMVDDDAATTVEDPAPAADPTDAYQTNF